MSLKEPLIKQKKQNRQDLLYSQSRSTSAINPYTRIVTTFSNEQSQVKLILNKYWHVLTSDPPIGPFISPTPLVTFRRNTSIGDLVVKS